MLDIESYLLGKKAGGGGGGNPNYTETYTGTVADVLTNLTVEKRELLSTALLGSVDSSAFIDVDASALGMGSFNQRLFCRSSTGVFETNSAEISSDSSLANEIRWDSDGTVLMAYIEQDGTITDLSPYASMVGATITYCYHPTPSGS